MSVIYYQSRGFSMEPYLLDGDELIVEPIAGASLQAGDVALYRSSAHAEPVAHRVVSIDRERGTFVSRSDAYLSQRETVPFASLVGRVLFSRRGARLLRIAGTPAASFRNRALVLWLPAAAALKRALEAVVTGAGSRNDPGAPASKSRRG